jgi:hypothetical protein
MWLARRRVAENFENEAQSPIGRTVGSVNGVSLHQRRDRDGFDRDGFAPVDFG